MYDSNFPDIAFFVWKIEWLGFYAAFIFFQAYDVGQLT